MKQNLKNIALALPTYITISDDSICKGKPNESYVVSGEILDSSPALYKI